MPDSPQKKTTLARKRRVLARALLAAASFSHLPTSAQSFLPTANRAVPVVSRSPLLENSVYESQQNRRFQWTDTPCSPESAMPIVSLGGSIQLDTPNTLLSEQTFNAITKEGSGSVTLVGSSSYGGSTDVRAGVLDPKGKEHSISSGILSQTSERLNSNTHYFDNTQLLGSLVDLELSGQLSSECGQTVPEPSIYSIATGLVGFAAILIRRHR